MPADTARTESGKQERTAIDELLDRQRRAPIPVLYGQRTWISSPGHELVKAGVSEVIDQGNTVVVLFSAVNAEDHAVELMPPQIQLGGMKKTGKIIRKSRWSIAEQLPVTDSRMSRRRLGPGERADGVVIFQRPLIQTIQRNTLSPDGGIGCPVLSRWPMDAFQIVIEAATKRQIFVTPIRNEVAAPESEWVPITDGSGLDRNAVWSPDGNLLYFLSERDGFRCVWAQRLSASTKHLSGAPFAVYHFHQARRSLMPAQEVARIGLSVMRDKIIFSMAETNGNIWLANFQ